MLNKHIKEIRNLNSTIIDVNDIISKNKTEDRLESSEKEKEILIKEIHHRVKNNLQIISSLLNLQAQYIKDKDSLNAFHDSQNRVRAIALVHEKLYQTKNFAKIDFPDYVRDLVSNLVSTINPGVPDVHVGIDVEELYLSMDLAINLGLIITELVSNSLKHAFKNNKRLKEDETDELLVSLKSQTNSRLKLKVTDNGIGFDYSLIVKKNSTLGLQLVQGFVEQIKGDLTFSGSAGSEFEIVFPIL
jgi:two-component sensor histidine kinase